MHVVGWFCVQLKADDYTEVAKALKKLLSDANLSVVAGAVRAIGSLARPLGRAAFGQHARKLTPILFEKCGVKNTQVTSAINTCLEGFSSTSCISLPEALEIAPSGTSAANPLVQGCALRWLKTIAHAAPAAVMGQ